jgi:hypothetical protein
LAGFSPEDIVSSTFSLQIYHKELGIWAAVDTNHVIAVYEGSRIFMKSACISICHGLDHLLQPSTHQPDLQTNPAGKKAFVKHMECKIEHYNKHDKNCPPAVVSPILPSSSHHVPMSFSPHHSLPGLLPCPSLCSGPLSSSLSWSLFSIKQWPPVTPRTPFVKHTHLTSAAKPECHELEIIEVTSGSENEVIILSSDSEASNDISKQHIKQESIVKKEDLSLSLSMPI